VFDHVTIRVASRAAAERFYVEVLRCLDVDERIKLGRYIENMTSVTTLVEAMHGAGSPQAQRIVMLGQADIESKIAMADEVINGTDDVPGLPLPGRTAEVVD
jgi:aromatic ring hydroxylase